MFEPQDPHLCINFKLIATEIGDAVKYHATLSHIDRMGMAVFPFRRSSFAHDAITSQRARRVFDWIMTLGNFPCELHERTEWLVLFVERLARDRIVRIQLLEILRDHGIPGVSPASELTARFDSLLLHEELKYHCRSLFAQRLFFHVVAEAAKILVSYIRTRSGSCRDGEALMMTVWDAAIGPLKVTNGKTDTDRNVQDGLKFLSAGVVRTFRNPTAHEPALHWPISEQDAVEMLGLVSFLMRQVDRAVRRRHFAVLQTTLDQLKNK